MSAVAYHYFLRNEMNLFTISSEIYFDNAEAYLPIFISCNWSLHFLLFGFFVFQRQLICFVPEFFLKCLFFSNFI